MSKQTCIKKPHLERNSSKAVPDSSIAVPARAVTHAPLANPLDPVVLVRVVAGTLGRHLSWIKNIFSDI
jgi:hypothetical protein